MTVWRSEAMKKPPCTLKHGCILQELGITLAALRATNIVLQGHYMLAVYLIKLVAARHTSSTENLSNSVCRCYDPKSRTEYAYNNWQTTFFVQIFARTKFCAFSRTTSVCAKLLKLAPDIWISCTRKSDWVSFEPLFLASWKFLIIVRTVSLKTSWLTTLFPLIFGPL